MNKSLNKRIEIIHLYNFYDHFEIPDDFPNYGNGISISSTKLNKRIVD